MVRHGDNCTLPCGDFAADATRALRFAETSDAEKKRKYREEEEMHRANRYAEKKRKDELLDLQVHLTRLNMDRHKLPTAKEVKEAFEKALWKSGPYERSHTEHVEILEDAFRFIMESIKTHRVDEYKNHSHAQRTARQKLMPSDFFCPSL